MDLSPTVEGFGGIAQDARTLFKALAAREDVEVGGLLWGRFFSTVHARSGPISKAAYLRWQADFLCALKYKAPFRSPHERSGHGCAWWVRYGVQLGQKAVAILRWISSFFQRKRTLFKIQSEFLFDLVWDQFFRAGLGLEDFGLLSEQSYYGTSLTKQDLLFAGLYRLPHLLLDTQSWDVLVMHSPSFLKVSPKTRLVIRYHDSIPLYRPDVNPASEGFAGALDASAQQAYFLANSKRTLASLVALYPELAARSAVYPCEVASCFKPKHDLEWLTLVFKQHVSSECTAARLKGNSMSSLDHFEYVLVVSTIEPRKNMVHTIRAWQLWRARTTRDVKLVMVGSLGWMYEETVALMRPLMAEGSLIHLEQVRPSDLVLLYAHARFLACLSLDEGFGLSPLEAHQCGIPVLTPHYLSDEMDFQSTAGLIHDLESAAEAMKEIDDHPRLNAYLEHHLEEAGHLREVALEHCLNSVGIGLER